MGARTKSQSPAPPARTVPRGPARAAEIREVAEAVFLERGYTDATMDEIAGRANASKATLYKHFGSKEAMFATIVSSRVPDISTGRLALSSGSGLDRILEDWALETLERVTAPRTAALYQLILTELRRAPELGLIFYERGPGEAIRQLAGFIRQADAAGALRCRNPDTAGAQLGSLIFSRPFARAAIGLPPVEEGGLEAHVREAIAMFLSHYGAPSAPSEISRPPGQMSGEMFGSTPRRARP